MTPSRSKLPHAVIAVVAGAIPAFLSGNAGADGSFGADGTYRQGAMREDFTVQQWLAGCGAAPTSTTKGGGESITVKQSGTELVMIGGGRTFRTDQCYDPLPTLVADVHSREGGSGTGAALDWRTHCATPDGDPRRATIQTLVAQISTDRIDVTETGRYEVTIDQGRCIADVKRTRTFDRLVGGAATTAPVTAAPATTSTAAVPQRATNDAACANPGAPASLEVRPARKALKPGESFTFKAEVRDTASCVTGQQPTWSIAGADPFAPGSSGTNGPRATVDSSGRVTVPADAAEGVATLLVTAAGRSAQVEIDVTSAAHYDELLANGGLDASADDAARVSLVAIPAGTGVGEPVRAQDESAQRRAIFIAIVGLFAASLAVVAFFFHRRTKKAEALEKKLLERHAEKVREVEARRESRRKKHAAEQRAHLDSLDRVRRAKAEEAEIAKTPSGVPLQCPTCRREFPALDLTGGGSASGGAFCPYDATRLVAVPEAAGPAGRVSAANLGTSGSICPTCHRGYAAGVKSCPADGDELVPAGLAAASQARGAIAAPVVLQARGKICPTCGDRFDGSAVFCGKDGTSLVLLN